MALLAHYKFENDYTDSSASGFDGTAAGTGNSFDTVNVIKDTYSLSTNGSGYMTAGDNIDLASTEAFTVSVWIKGTGAGTLVAKQNDWGPHTNDGWILILNSATALYWQHNAGATPTSSTEVQVNWTGLTVNDGNWHHIVLTKSTSALASGLTLYIDGADQGAPSTTDFDNLSGSTGNASNLSVASQGTGTSKYTGNIDNVKIEKREWAASEVATEFGGIIFDAASSGNSTGSVSSFTISHTCTGSDLILWVWTVNGNTSTQHVSGVTYNGVAMTKVSGTEVSEAVTGTGALWYLLNPATGANNIVATLSTADVISMVSSSYVGVRQSGQPEVSTSSSTSTASTTFSNTLSTDANRSWTIQGVTMNQFSTITAGSGTTRRASVTGSSGVLATAMMDSSSQVTPANSKTLNDTSSSGKWLGGMVSFAPATANYSFQTDTAGTLTTNLLAYYKTEADMNDVWGGFNMTPTGDTYVSGKVNNALDGDASTTHAYVSSAGNLSLGDQDFSVAFWRFVPSGGVSSTFESLVNQWNYPEAARQWAFDNTVGTTATANTLTFGVSSNGLDTGTNQVNYTTTSDNNTWIHVIGTYNASTNVGTLYIDGTSQGTLSGGMYATAGSYTQVSGQGGSTLASGTLQGGTFVDEVGIWDKVLSSQEITDLYNSGSGQTMVIPSTSTFIPTIMMS